MYQSPDRKYKSPSNIFKGLKGHLKVLINLLKQKKILLVVLVCLVLAFSVFAYAVLVNDNNNNNNNPILTGVLCRNGSSIYSEAMRAYNSGDLAALTDTVDKIKDDPGHTSDPNCLTILAEYSILKNTDASQWEYLEQVDSLVDDEYELSKEFNSIGIYKVKDVRERVNHEINLMKESSDGVPSSL